MAEIKLAKLPDRTPVKLALLLSPQLHQDLLSYQSAYALAYGREEPICELATAMLAAFLASDRTFVRSRGRK